MKYFIRLLVIGVLGVKPTTVAADERIGADILLQDDGTSVYYGAPRTASDGVGTFVVWSTAGGPVPAVMSARIDGAGNVSGPFTVASGFPYKRDVDIANDGRNALVVWADDQVGPGAVRAVRLDPNGQPIESVPLTLDSAGDSSDLSLMETHVAFDGIFYRVLWVRFKAGIADSAKVYTQRIGTDGATFSRRINIRPRDMASLPFLPRIACRGGGECLVIWVDSAGGYRVQGVRILADDLLDRTATVLLRDVYQPEIATNRTDYLIVGVRNSSAVFAGRVSTTGLPLDLDGFQVNNPPAQGTPYIAAAGVTFDGTNYLAAFADEPTTCAWKLFGARITPGGQVLDPDVPGLLLHDAGTAISVALAATRTHAVAAWADYRVNQACAGYPPRSVYAQRVLAHADAPALPNAEIGTIGPRSTTERAALAFTVSASALDQANTTFSATNLPPGAVFDAATRTFRWEPAANESGVYPAVQFTATDGAQTVSEDVTISVGESSLSLCGVVEDSNGALPGVTLKLKGSGKPRIGISDATGHFCFSYLIQRSYLLKLAPPSTHQYRARALTVPVTSGDVQNVHLVVAAR